MSEIPVEEWFVFRPEAETYLNKVASEIRLMASGDAMLERLIRFMPERHVEYVEYGAKCRNCGYWHGNQFEFRFEMDRGRPTKGHLYAMRGSTIVRVGSDCEAFLESDAKNVEGKDLLNAIREIVIESVMQM